MFLAANVHIALPKITIRYKRHNRFVRALPKITIRYNRHNRFLRAHQFLHAISTILTISQSFTLFNKSSRVSQLFGWWLVVVGQLVVVCAICSYRDHTHFRSIARNIHKIFTCAQPTTNYLLLFYCWPTTDFDGGDDISSQRDWRLEGVSILRGGGRSSIFIYFSGFHCFITPHIDYLHLLLSSLIVEWLRLRQRRW